MAAATITNNTEQLQGFITNRYQQQKNEFCDITLATNNTSIDCHKTVLSSASSYFSQLLCDSEHNTNIIDVTPLPEHLLRTVVAFMYDSEYVIDDENVIDLLNLCGTWNLDILAKLCVSYINDNVTINNACRFYNFALDNVDHDNLQFENHFIRKHFTSLHESGQLSELSLKSFNTLIEHDAINVKNEDVIFSTAVQIINKETSVEDINRCLELIRFPHTSVDFLVNVILHHQLMKDPHREKYSREAILYQVKKTSTRVVEPPRYWGRGIYYIGNNRSMYQYASRAGNNECVKMIKLPTWVDDVSSIASHRERVVIVGGRNDRGVDKRALLLDMTDNTKVTQLPNLPEPRHNAGVVLSDNGVYVVGGFNISCSSSVHYLSFRSGAWQTKKSMPGPVSRPLVIQHHQCIYVLGGSINNCLQFSVLQYNIKDDTWRQCNDMPVACDKGVSGVVVHEDRIKVFTVDKCLMYADDTDTWTVKQYSELGYSVNAFVKRGLIYAAVRNGRTYSMMSYDDVDNVWKTEHERLDKALNTKLFC